MPIPSQGFFQMYARSVGQIVSGNFARTSVGAPPPIATQDDLSAYYLAGVDDPATAPRLHQSVEFPGGSGFYNPAAGTYELQIFPKTTIVFDSSGTPTPLSILDADFPLGFAASQMRVWINGNLVTGGRNKYLNNYKFKARGSTVLDVNPPNNINGDFTTSSNEFGPTALSNAHWGTNQVFGSTMGFSATVADVVDATALTPNFRSDLVYIQGVYNLLVFNITSTSQNVGPGGEVIITGTNLTLLDELSIDWYDAAATSSEWLDPMIPNIVGGIVVPRNLIFTWTATQIVFRIPFSQIPYGGKRLMVMGRQTSGVSFTGRTLLQNLNVQLVEGSGLYKLVDNKRNDTYYDRSVSPVVTIDLKIPDPFVKTGFFNG